MSPPAQRSEGLERHVDAVMTELRAERRRRARESGKLASVGAALDAALRTTPSSIWTTGYPEKGKLGIALGLHMMNVASASYSRFFTMLRPTLQAIEARHGRPARWSWSWRAVRGGSRSPSTRSRGGAALAWRSRLGHRSALRDARSVARRARRGASHVRHLDALDMESIADAAYDVIFIAQSVHHFSPGKLARMIAASRRVALTAFVSVDGYRSLGMVAFISGRRSSPSGRRWCTTPS